MGAIYRLLATGVRTIVLIDGVFHASTPVWQREILAALKEGITVIGSSSMGALRAAELAPYGMIGYGTVFKWYAQGRIEGDDEVALLHADADHDYCGLSEALVNMRHNLERACRAGILTSDQGVDLLAYLKGLYYGERTYKRLFASPPFSRLSRSAQRALQMFLGTQIEDIKRLDAIETLKLCATRGEEVRILAATTLLPGPSLKRPVEIWMRGVLAATGVLIPGRELLILAAQDEDATREIVRRASRRFYLLQWMQQRDVQLPAREREAFYTQWCQRYVKGELAAWLAANGLTQSEFEEEVADRAAEVWLLEQDPSTYGLPGKAYRPNQKVVQEAVVDCFLNDWAEGCGIECPQDVLQRYAGHPQSLSQWLLDQSPVYFGYDQWTADMVFARDLQVTGKMAELAHAWREDAEARNGVVSLGDASVGAT
jgi:hypothetical protein